MPKTMLVTTIKDEGPTILEWVAHHRVVGFDTIQVYQNDSTDGTQKTLRALEDVGAIEYYRNPSPKKQWQNRAYRRASFSSSYAESDWCMTLDGDEFLNVKIGSGSVKDLISKCPDADAILVNWRSFGSMGQRELSPDMVTERFVMAEPEADIGAKRPCGFKSLFRTASYARPGIHRAKAPVKMDPVIRNGSGLHEGDFYLKNWRSFDPDHRKLAQINHYPLRDLQSFLIKCARGSASHVDRKIDHKYWTKFDRNDEEDTSIGHLAEKVRNEIERLNALTDGRLFKLRSQSFKIWQAKVGLFAGNPEIVCLRDQILAGASDHPIIA